MQRVQGGEGSGWGGFRVQRVQGGEGSGWGGCRGFKGQGREGSRVRGEARLQGVQGAGPRQSGAREVQARNRPRWFRPAMDPGEARRAIRVPRLMAGRGAGVGPRV